MPGYLKVSRFVKQTILEVILEIIRTKQGRVNIR